MNPILRIPTSQQLRFVNRGYYESTPLRYDTRLHNDVAFLNRSYKPYCQLISLNTDSIWVQFRSTYVGFKCAMYRSGTNTKLLDLEPINIGSFVNPEGDTVYVYNMEVPVVWTGGKYFVEIKGYQRQMPEVTFWSEPFLITPDIANTQVVKWGGGYSISDGMKWSANEPYGIDRYQQLRLKSRIIDLKFGTAKSTYIDGNNDLTTLAAYPSATHNWNIEEIPYYMTEILALALQHDVFMVDDVQYNIAEGFDMPNFVNALMTSGSIPLTMLNYENYVTDPVLTGTAPDIPDEERWTRVDTRTTRIETRKINR